MLNRLKKKAKQLIVDGYVNERLGVFCFSDFVLYDGTVAGFGEARSSKKVNTSFSHLGYKHSPLRAFKESVTEKSFEMRLCYPGTFMMGHKGSHNNPEKEVNIERAFLLCTTEVTQELYTAVMKEEDNPSYYKGGIGGLAENADVSKHPVENMSIYEAIKFCNELSELQGLEPFYKLEPHPERLIYPNRMLISFMSKSKGYRLPTEVEWEYAAKAGTNNKWSGTDSIEALDLYAHHGKGHVWGTTPEEMGHTYPVATKKPNDWGFYDMSGNVWEWCMDREFNLNPASGEHLALGGSFRKSVFDSVDAESQMVFCRKKFSTEKSTEGYVIGFRIARYA